MLMISINNLSNNQELITGIREDGTIYSIYSFARKVGQAVAGGLGGFALSAVGYDATLKVQTEYTSWDFLTEYNFNGSRLCCSRVNSTVLLSIKQKTHPSTYSGFNRKKKSITRINK